MLSNTRLERFKRITGEVRGNITSLPQFWLSLSMTGWWMLLRSLRIFFSVHRLISLAAPGNPVPRYQTSDVTHCLQTLDHLGFWSRSGDCLPRSLVCRRFLTLAGLDSRLVIGFDGLMGHSWVELNGAPFLDLPNIEIRYPPSLILLPGEWTLKQINL